MNRDRAVRRRDDEDAAAVMAVLTALAADAAPEHPVPERRLWGSPAYRLGADPVGPHGWWASGMPR